MRGLVPRWGGGGERQNPRCQFAVPHHNSSLSNLGVPAPAGMSDCYKNMPSNRPQCRPPTGETCRVVDPRPSAERENEVRSKTTRGEGLVPRWGGGGERQNRRSQFVVPSRNSGFSNLGVPAPAGMSDCYKNMPSNRPQCRLSTGETCRVVDPWPMAERENVERSKTSRGEGLVPRWGGGGARQNPRSQFAVPSHNSVSSYLGGPATAGMTDRCESMSRTPSRDRLPPPVSSLVRK